MYYTAICLNDGTILAAYPVRKPVPKIIKRDKLKIDEEGVCHEQTGAGKELSDAHNESRFRFQDIISTRLNMKRLIREMIFPYLIKLQKDITEVHNKLDQIQKLMSHQSLK